MLTIKLTGELFKLTRVIFRLPGVLFRLTRVQFRLTGDSLPVILSKCPRALSSISSSAYLEKHGFLKAVPGLANNCAGKSDLGKGY